MESLFSSTTLKLNRRLVNKAATVLHFNKARILPYWLRIVFIVGFATTFWNLRSSELQFLCIKYFFLNRNVPWKILLIRWHPIEWRPYLHQLSSYSPYLFYSWVEIRTHCREDEQNSYEVLYAKTIKTCLTDLWFDCIAFIMTVTFWVSTTDTFLNLLSILTRYRFETWPHA